MPKNTMRARRGQSPVAVVHARGKVASVDTFKNAKEAEEFREFVERMAGKGATVRVLATIAL